MSKLVRMSEMTSASVSDVGVVAAAQATAKVCARCGRSTSQAVVLRGS